MMMIQGTFRKIIVCVILVLFLYIKLMDGCFFFFLSNFYYFSTFNSIFWRALILSILILYLLHFFFIYKMIYEYKNAVFLIGKQTMYVYNIDKLGFWHNRENSGTSKKLILFHRARTAWYTHVIWCVYTRQPIVNHL